jgi:hypothetical protein
MNRGLRRGGLGRSTAFITALVFAAGCAPSNPSDSSASVASIGASPSATTVKASASPSEPPHASESPIDVASLTGRIVFDNYDDVWSINADGTGLTASPTHPGTSSTPRGPRTELRSRTVPNPTTIRSSGS